MYFNYNLYWFITTAGVAVAATEKTFCEDTHNYDLLHILQTDLFCGFSQCSPYAASKTYLHLHVSRLNAPQIFLVCDVRRGICYN